MDNEILMNENNSYQNQDSVSSNENAVEMSDITMIFNNNLVANDHINLTVKKGEIHALVGENGAGKSTLMSILFGLYEPTKGTIKINGKPQIISSPIVANYLGIGMVHQHFKLVNIFTAWENIALGEEKTKMKGLIVDKKAIKEKIQKVMDKYNLVVDLDAKVCDLSVGAQQKVEILKILYRDSNILVFDEPTAVLSPKEIKGLLEIIKKLRDDGKTIILITHKLEEIKAVADRATVIRRGKYIDTFDIKTTTPDQLAEAMVGRKIVHVKNNYDNHRGEKVIDIVDLNVKKVSNHKVMALENFNLNVHTGEIVAICGVEGNGQQELIGAITGLAKPASGKILIRDKNITNASIKDRYKKYKMAHIPEDRQKHGLVLDMNLIDNIVLQDISSQQFSKFGFLKFNSIQTYAQKVISTYDVRNASSGFAVARQLSGGNQQKAIVGRELNREHDFAIICQPTRGLDVGSIEFIHSEILKMRNQGKAILLLSYELEEILALADRIVVLNGGLKVGEINGADADTQKLGMMMIERGKNEQAETAI